MILRQNHQKILFLAKILNFWKLSKEVLFTKTRNIWLKDFKPQNTTKDLIGSGFDTSD